MKHVVSWRALLAVIAVAALGLGMASALAPGLWLTPDQRGDRLLARGEYEEAAKAYADPFRRGAALYRAGRFEEAAAAFSTAPGYEAAFDRGNALLMRGKYRDAVSAYDRALELRSGWKEAEDNRSLAQVREKMLHPDVKDRTGTGGQLRPDEIVFDKTKAKSKGDVDVTEGGKPSDEELRGLWLRRVRTKPADFLRAKFAFQARNSPEGGK